MYLAEFLENSHTLKNHSFPSFLGRERVFQHQHLSHELELATRFPEQQSKHATYLATVITTVIRHIFYIIAQTSGITSSRGLKGPPVVNTSGEKPTPFPVLNIYVVVVMGIIIVTPSATVFRAKSRYSSVAQGVGRWPSVWVCGGFISTVIYIFC